jgi:hypothetical protein
VSRRSDGRVDVAAFEQKRARPHAFYGDGERRERGSWTVSRRRELDGQATTKPVFGESGVVSNHALTVRVHSSEEEIPR